MEMTEQEIRDLLRSIDKLAKEHDKLGLYFGNTFGDLAEVVNAVAVRHLGDRYTQVVEEEYERAMSNDDAK